VMRLKPQQPASGVRYTRGGSSIVLKHAFIAKMPTGHEGVFMRTNASRRRPRLPPKYAELPIEEQYTASVLATLRGVPQLLANAKTDATATAKKMLEDQVERLLRQAG